MQYRTRLRGYDFAGIEQVVRYSTERYVDTVTGRRVVIGHHDDNLVMIPYETAEGTITPVTHATTRRQIRFRLQSGRFSNE